MPVLIDGMHGLGDGIYSRAVIRQYLARYDEIWLTTPWPQIWHDMPLRLVDPVSHLRTQRKNSDRSRYEPRPDGIEVLKLWYFAAEIRDGKWDSLPNAMLGNMGCSIPGDYRLPVPRTWVNKARALLPLSQKPLRIKPLLIYRPLTFRTEWRASAVRNPERAAFAAIFAAIRDRFFVVSIADVDGDAESLVSDPIDADLTFHRGEVDTETLIGLFKIADCVFAAPGFALALAQAVGTPSVVVFGGHESSKAYRSSASFAPCLMIDPISPCDCFNQQHQCDKRIDVDQAVLRLTGWVDHLDGWTYSDRLHG